MTELIIATKWEVKEEGGKRSIQLYDSHRNKVDGDKAKWGGSFYCSNNQLTSLAGAPSEVGGVFYCDNNQLTSLAGAPSEIGGEFHCGNNQLTSLAGAPSEIGGDFSCGYNKLTSLAGAPSEIGGSFYCHNNKLTSLAGAPSEVSGQTIAHHIFKEKLKRGYVFADGILQKLISRKSADGTDIFKVRKLGTKKKSFVVRNEGGLFSHGDSVREAINDLQYKIGNRDTTEFKSWTVETMAPRSKVIEAYRKITGACGAGTRGFVSSRDIPDELRVRDVITLTKGHYGHEEFRRFFN